MTHSRSHRRARVALALTVVAVVAIAACGGDSKKTVATSTSTAASTTSSSAGSSTTASTAAGTTTSGAAAATSTTVAPGPTYPMTGLPADDAARLNRPALVIKINNVASARPQSGLNQADVVFEEKIGTSVTRLLSVFQSTDAAKVGSIRSARATDLPILAALSKPLFAWSGANQNLFPKVRDADLTDIGYSKHSGLYKRGRSLPDYQEFFIDTADAWGETPEGQGAPKPIFTFRRPTDPAPTGQAVKSAAWSYKGYVVEWVWDAAKGGWLRTQAGTPHVDADEVQVAPANVVMMFIKYKAAFDDPRSPEAVSTGTGAVWVLTNGVLVGGTWERPNATDPFVFKDAKGAVIPLTPGHTWVELAEEDSGEFEPA